MLKNHEKELMISINLFLDNILKINNLFKTLLQKYFDKKFDDVQKVTDQISNLESECDALRRDVERRIALLHFMAKTIAGKKSELMGRDTLAL